MRSNRAITCGVVPKSQWSSPMWLEPDRASGSDGEADRANGGNLPVLFFWVRARDEQAEPPEPESHRISDISIILGQKLIVSSYKCSDISYHIPPQDAILLLSCSSVNPPFPDASGPTHQLLQFHDSHDYLSQTCIKLSNVISHQSNPSFSKTLPVVVHPSSRPTQHVENGQRTLSRHLAGFVRTGY